MKNHKELLQYLFRQDRQLSRIYGNMAQELGAILKRYKVHGKSSVWYKNAEIKKQVDRVLSKYQKLILNHISENISGAWDLSEQHNDNLVNQYLKGIPINEALESKYLKRNYEALSAFINRGKKGFKLSDKVWQLTRQTRNQLETFLSEGLSEGRSAVELTKDVQRYLKTPEKRFRRIRDKKTGKLKISDPAKKYNPGQGIYRSSFKNALRLTRNEISIAYRMADHERRKKLDFVVGITVNLSPAHPRYDICDELAGEYPKGFVFTGWHPNCLCFTTSKLLPKKVFLDFLNGKKIDANMQVNSIPKRAKRYLNKNAEKINGLSNQPYFIKDNFEYTKKGYKLKL